jgi:hypothetical protein
MKSVIEEWTMEDSAKGKNQKSAAAAGPTGPRTREGKARSSRNSGTHLIFSRRVPERQEKEAAVLRRKLQEQFQPRGAFEEEIVYDLVINRMQKRRIDEYEAGEFDKANSFIVKARYKKDEFRQSQAWLRLASTGDEALETWHRRLPPSHCISFLGTLKEMREARHLGPDKEIKFLRSLYKGQFTPHAAELMKDLSSMKHAQSECQSDTEQVEQIDQQFRASIAQIIDKEIEYQKSLSESEAEWDDIEFPVDGRILPADPIFDRIERYRTANAREFSRLLEQLETVRRLCSKK